MVIERIQEELMMKSLVSVVVPVYNKKKYLRRCIDSILKQQYESLEIILVDDGSFDGSEKICDQYSEIDARVKVVHKNNGGLSSARNKGIEIATGKYIVFIDSDDIVHPEYIERMVSVKEDTKAQIVQCRMKSVSADFKENKVNLQKMRQKILSGKNAILSYEYKVSACAKIFDIELFDSVRFPLGKIYEDEGTYYKIAFQCQRVCLIDSEMYLYVQVPMSITRNNSYNMDFISIGEERIEFFKNVGDEELLQNAYVRFGITLILKHCTLKKRKIDKKIQEQLILIFRDNIKRIEMKKLNIRDFILFTSYRYFPNLIVNILGIIRSNA